MTAEATPDNCAATPPVGDRGRPDADAQPARGAQRDHPCAAGRGRPTRCARRRPGRAVRAVVITGAGRGFCSGQDLRAAAGDGGLDVGAILRDHYTPAIRAIRSMDQPVIAAVNGVAAGAGFSLALACDLRIAAEFGDLRAGVRPHRAHPRPCEHVLPAPAHRPGARCRTHDARRDRGRGARARARHRESGCSRRRTRRGRRRDGRPGWREALARSR